MSAIPSWARVGAKVVCIKGATRNKVGGWAPQTNGIYTIRSTFFAEGWGWFIRVEEFVACDVLWNGIEPGWDLPRFRPLVTLSSDIAEHFEHLLDVPASHEREAEAA